MKNRGKHRRILILMIASQLLLTGFIIQWLLSQYKGEKETLVKEFTSFYIESHDVVLDSMLYKGYVNPVLSENRIIVMDQVGKRKDTVRVGSATITATKKKGKLRVQPEKDIISINIDGKCDTLRGSPDSIKLSRMPGDMLLRSVRLIVAHSQDTIHMKSKMPNSFSIDLDTGLFKKNFRNRMSGPGMKFDLKWETKKSAQPNGKGKNLIHINPFLEYTLPDAIIGHYNSYLVGKILPQLIFGTVLVLLTAFAFLLAYRSIRNQIILNSLRDEFVGNITHELKTPVSTLKVALESLGKFNMKNEPALMEEYLRLASLEINRLEDLINRVLDYSVLDESIHPMNFAETDINNLISEVVNAMQQKLGEKGNIGSNQNEESIIVVCDPIYLKGVLINLVDNSIKYCDKKPVILIRSGIKDGYAEIEVSDNGPGIPEEYQKKVFEKFFRVPSHNIHNVKGYGLGLSFAQLVMKHHKGSIGVRNLDQGCSFMLKIPVS
jgi:signal transduction histidine kinase